MMGVTISHSTNVIPLSSLLYMVSNNTKTKKVSKRFSSGNCVNKNRITDKAVKYSR